MPKFGVIPSDIGEGVDAIRPEFDAPTENMESLTPLLYQSGYLTIKNFDAFGEVYHLGIPNKEIRVGLFQSLLPKYLGNKEGAAVRPWQRWLRSSTATTWTAPCG